MSIVGVYKEIQDQHMNIVSLSRKINPEITTNIYSYAEMIIFSVESVLCGFISAVGNEP